MRDADNSNERAPRIVPGEPARASSARERCKAGPDRQAHGLNHKRAAALFVPGATACNSGRNSMDKQRKSAAELAGMVTKMIGVGGLEVVVNSDPVDGWRRTVVKAPRTAERFQHLAEKTAEKLRSKYSLPA
jgi:hypothetical protein